jgi:DMSO/TMAO reductase YedYZ molybdopterin-dependent catalytic subunit
VEARRLPRPFRSDPPRGPFRPEWWRSPLRGPWLASLLGSALLPLIGICAVTGYLSHAAYDPGLASNAINSAGGLDLWPFDWPTSPAWLFAVNQGLHVTAGLMSIPLLLAKLWSVMPKLYEWPPLRTIAHALERLSLALLVGGSVFVLVTGVLNIQLDYPWHFSFVPAHWWGAVVFVAALALHVGLKLPTVLTAFRARGVVAPLRESLPETRPEPYRKSGTAPRRAAEPTLSRRGFVAGVGGASALLGVIAGAQSVGGPVRTLGLLAPHGRDPGPGPNGFQVNKTARAVGIRPAQTGDGWRLRLERAGSTPISISRDQLLAMPQATERLPIACVEGWSTTQTWTGVRLRDLARMAGAASGHAVRVESLQSGGSFRQATLAENQLADPRSLLALGVNGADLALDHGFPARVIVPALPGVHCTKWVQKMTFLPS